MVADVVWPTHLLPPTGGRVAIVSATIGGGKAMSGLEQAVASDAGYFTLKMGSIPINSNLRAKTWNAIEAILGGRVGTALIPALDCKRAPWPIADSRPVTNYGAIPFSDGSLFDDGSGFGQNVIDAVAEATITAGSMTASIRLRYGSDLGAGQHFSANERLFRIARVLSQSASGDETVYSIRLALPAREEIPSGTQLNFDCPLFRAVLATDGEMALDLNLMKFGSATINWVEDV